MESREALRGLLSTEAVVKVLGAGRTPRPAGDVPHTYDDKFALVEMMTEGAATATVAALEVLGLPPARLAALAKQHRADRRRVTLSFSATETCEFTKKTTEAAEGDGVERTSTGVLGRAVGKLLNRYDVWHWRHGVDWELRTHCGADPEEGAESVAKRSGSLTLSTRDEEMPRPARAVKATLAMDLTWLLQRLPDADGAPLVFRVDRTARQCRTPRRNPDVDGAVAFFKEACQFAEAWGRYLDQFCDGEELDRARAVRAFVPVHGLLEGGARSAGLALASSSPPPSAGDEDGRLFSASDCAALALEQRRSLGAAQAACAEEGRWADASDPGVFTRVEGTAVVVARHIADIAATFLSGAAYIEERLYHQLAAAIGQTVSAADFRAYMDYHCRRLFTEAFRPRPFAYNIGRAGRDPEGVLALETAPGAPLRTLTHALPPAPVRFAIDAATEVCFTGARFVHAYIGQRFSTEALETLAVAAEARQFSGYVVLLGHMGEDELFLPKHAVVVRDKATLKVPLHLKEIPSAKEFRRAVASMSEEQRQFASAYRAMQLEATLFAICVVQIRPQLEAVLRLPCDALAKELELSQAALALFDKFSTPSSVLAATDDTLAVEERVAQVRRNVDRITAHIKKKGGTVLPERSPKSVESEIRRRNDRARLSFYLGSVSAEIEDEDCEDESRCLDSDVEGSEGGSDASGIEEAPEDDAEEACGVCAIPARLEERFLKHTGEDTLRPVVIKAAEDGWCLGSAPLDLDKQRKEKDAAFSLLTALTRSGALPLAEAELHVLVASSHCFDKSVVDTVVQDNVDPIVSVERSVLLAASTVLDVPVPQLLCPTQVDRVLAASPQLVL